MDEQSQNRRATPAAITNDLPSVVCWVSQMASSSISHSFASPKKATKEKATPVCRPLRGHPRVLGRSGFLLNSYDPLRGHVLKHIRQNSLTSLRYSMADEGYVVWQYLGIQNALSPRAI